MKAELDAQKIKALRRRCAVAIGPIGDRPCKMKNLYVVLILTAMAAHSASLNANAQSKFRIHHLSAEPRLGAVVASSDPSDFREVTEAAQTYPAFMAEYQNRVFTIAFDSNRKITYIGTNDPKVTTPEGIHVGSSLLEVQRAGAKQPWAEPGWAYHTVLSSGWNVAFTQGPTMTEGRLKPDAKVRWLFKRMRSAA